VSAARCLLIFEPPDGGVAENVMRLALGLPERGFEVTLAGPHDALPYAQLEGRVPIHRLPFERGYGHPARDAAALRALIALLRRERFDLAHAHSAKAGVLGRIAAKVTGTPSLYSPHCFPFVGPWGMPRRVFSTAVERGLGPVTDGILCVADQERRLALDKHLVPEEALHVVHNGAPPCEFEGPRDAALDEWRGDGPLAACIAVLRPQKAVHVFVDAAPAVLARVPDARLAVVGNGELRAELEQRARALGLDGRLRFFDFVPPAARQLASLDVFVLPSSWEAFPISVLEAMACGVPQIATDVGGTAEAVADDETGFLCPPEDPVALADRLARLLGDAALRARMADASRHRFDQHFRIETMLDGTAAVYERMIASSRRAGR
jgi:glycosyltransferase involved in cell wall biosynthesis